MNIFDQITEHLLKDKKPSEYIKSLPMDKAPFDTFKALMETKQSKIHHPEGNVWNHTLLVVDEAAKLRERSKDKKVFMWAALLHDIGKPETTKVRKGKITAYNHDKVGAEKAIEFLSHLTDDDVFIKKVSSLIRWHMQILFVVNDLPFKNIKQMLKEVDPYEIALLGYCDRIGRLNPDIEKEKKNIKLFIEKVSTFDHFE
jgi:putative nucleotidyltransferase with HDIG domain